MSYDLYIDGTLMPVTPAKVQVKHKNKNKTVDLINYGEVNIVKKEGLLEISLDLLIPNQKYPFANYPNGYQKAQYYVSKLESLKASGKSFQFILSRSAQNGNNLGNLNETVTIEDLTITDDASEGTDIKAGIKLKKWVSYGTKTFQISKDTSGTKTISEESQRTPSADEPQSGGTYTVQKGDTLWAIAKAKYGNGADYTKIVSANKDKVSNPNLIYPGQVLTIP